MIMHLVQSTAFAVAIGLLTLLFRKDGARVRYGLWLAASLKFLIPFSILSLLGWELRWQSAPSLPLEPLWLTSNTPWARPHPDTAAPLLTILWTVGAVAVALWWLNGWRLLRRAIRQAVPLPIAAPIAVLSVPGKTEPCLFGFLRPVILLPEGITDHLSAEQLAAIVEHELCHWRRRDNLTAALHMLVVLLFWFHPLVWWLGTRLIAEREAAVDEAVIQAGRARQSYAEAILSSCRFFLERSPLNAAGVSGGDLCKRMEAIMNDMPMRSLSIGKKSLLAVAGALTLALPVVVGLLSAATRADAMNADLKVPIALDWKRSCKIPDYPAQAAKDHVSGKTALKLKIDPEGNVVDSKVTASSGSDALDAAALAALSLCHFQPVKINGEPATVWAPLNYTWKLQ